MASIYYTVTTRIDPERVLGPLRHATAERMRHVGARIRLNMRRRLRYRKGSSRPGQPPNIHRSRTQQESPLARSILFGQADPLSVIVGAANIAGKAGMVAKVLEQGGMTKSADGKSFSIQARPFMKPAAYEETMKAPALWANSI